MSTLLKIGLHLTQLQFTIAYRPLKLFLPHKLKYTRVHTHTQAVGTTS